MERRSEHPSFWSEYRFSHRCADVFSEFAGEKTEVRFIRAVLLGKLPQSDATTKGKYIDF